MSNKSAAAVTERLWQVYGVDSDNQLSELLGIKRSTLGNWRARDSVPYSICVSCAEEKGVSLDWLLTGVGQMYRDHPATETVTATGLPPRQQAVLDLFNALPEEKQREILGAIEDKKRIVELEEQYRELKTALDSLKRTG